MRSLCVFAVATALLAASRPASAREVTFCVAGAVLSPARIDGRKWDGIGHVGDESLADASRAFAMAIASINPVAGAVAAVGLPALGYTEQPDAKALITVFHKGEARTHALPVVFDSSAPDWSARGCAIRVKPRRNTRIRINIVDADGLNQDDDVGSIELSRADLKRALKAQTILLIDTRAQGQGLVWGVCLSVMVD